MNCTSTMDTHALFHKGGENFSKLRTENIGYFLNAKIKVFISECSAEIGL